MRRKPTGTIFTTYIQYFFPIFRYKYEEVSSSVAYIQLNRTSISEKNYNFAASFL